MLVTKIGELSFYQGLRRMRRILLRFETYEGVIYQDLIWHRCYYLLTSGKLEFEIDELTVYRNLRRDELDSSQS